MSSPFEMLLEDLAAVQAQRTSRDAAARSARRIRPVCATAARPLKLAAPLPDYAPDWEGLQARQDKIAAEMEQARQQAQQDAIRAHLSVLRQAARAGRLSAHDAALYDVYRGQALALGLEA